MGRGRGSSQASLESPPSLDRKGTGLSGRGSGPSEGHQSHLHGDTGL